MIQGSQKKEKTGKYTDTKKWTKRMERKNGKKNVFTDVKNEAKTKKGRSI